MEAKRPYWSDPQRRLFGFLLLCWVVVSVAGCRVTGGQTIPLSTPTLSAPTALVTMPTPAPTSLPAPSPTIRFRATPLTFQETPMPPGTSIQPPFDAHLSAVVEMARADLSRRLSVAPADVTLVEVRSVIWPDGGLGCPRPGMVYPQVQVEGLLIRLRVAGRGYDYHSGGNRAPFLCE